MADCRSIIGCLEPYAIQVNRRLDYISNWHWYLNISPDILFIFRTWADLSLSGVTERKDWIQWSHLILMTSITKKHDLSCRKPRRSIHTAFAFLDSSGEVLAVITLVIWGLKRSNLRPVYTIEICERECRFLELWPHTSWGRIDYKKNLYHHLLIAEEQHSLHIAVRSASSIPAKPKSVRMEIGWTNICAWNDRQGRFLANWYQVKNCTTGDYIASLAISIHA